MHAVPLHATPFAKTIVCGEHAALQLPQFVTVRMLVSQPLLSLGGRQCAKPTAHSNVHCPAAQDGVLFTVLHAFPHCPQLRMSVARERQKPLQHEPPVPHGVPSPEHDSAHWPLGLHFELGPASAQSPSPMQSTQRCAVVLHR